MKTSQTSLIVYINIVLMLFYNYTFFKNTLEVYPLSSGDTLFVASLAILMVAFNVILFSLITIKYTIKPTMILVVIISAFTSYFMNTYNVVINTDMIRNVFQTDSSESLDLLSYKVVIYFLLLGVLPSIIIYKCELEDRGLKKELIGKLKAIVISLLIIVSLLLLFSKNYASFFREHKPLRYSINPVNWIYSVGDYINKTLNSGPIVVKKIGEDAKVIEDIQEPKELVIMVVGEAARADHFSINGYKKETNPLLKQEEIFDFSNMYSCGTSTAESVPCMFSMFGKSEYSYKKGISTQNILDVLVHSNSVDVLWRDNNSDSKGVATRVEFEDYKSSKNNTICDVECRDEGMLIGLDEYIKEHKGKDILIVLHQMGNHGPAYYKRYPKEFEKFTPVCKTNQLEECSQEEINNAYDNAILYTDYFLSKTINFLKKYDKTHETALVYMSDHGESLGENNLYLHGLPYFMAPDSQKHVASFIWFGDEMKEDIDLNKLKAKRDKNFTHDNLFHTLLGMFEVDTDVYNFKMDILNGDK